MQTPITIDFKETNIQHTHTHKLLEFQNVPCRQMRMREPRTEQDARGGRRRGHFEVEARRTPRKL